MRINNIETELTAEVKGNLADVIHFRKEGGRLMYVREVKDSLSPLSSVVVLRGDDPSLQYEEVVKLIEEIDDKKIVLQTGVFNRDLHNMCDKVVFVFKTFDMVHENIITHVNNHLDKYVPVVMIGHESNNTENFAILCRILDILYGPVSDADKLELSEQLQEIADKYDIKLVEFDKIPI